MPDRVHRFDHWVGQRQPKDAQVVKVSRARTVLQAFCLFVIIYRQSSGGRDTSRLPSIRILLLSATLSQVIQKRTHFARTSIVRVKVETLYNHLRTPRDTTMCFCCHVLVSETISTDTVGYIRIFHWFSSGAGGRPEEERRAEPTASQRKMVPYRPVYNGAESVLRESTFEASYQTYVYIFAACAAYPLLALLVHTGS
jgi:hypothetical protein